MGSILVVAVCWLFLLALALGILRSAGRLAVLVAVAVTLAGVGIGAPAAGAAACQLTHSGARMAPPRATLCLINRERRSRGLAGLIVNAQLARAATQHATDMVDRGYFAHLTPEGIDFTTRVRRAGYMRGCSSWFAGEALAWGSGSEASPASRVSAWMHSPPHREILLGAVYRDVGIAVLKGTPGFGSRGMTYAAEFGRRRC